MAEYRMRFLSYRPDGRQRWRGTGFGLGSGERTHVDSQREVYDTYSRDGLWFWGEDEQSNIWNFGLPLAISDLLELGGRRREPGYWPQLEDFLDWSDYDDRGPDPRNLARRQA